MKEADRKDKGCLGAMMWSDLTSHPFPCETRGPVPWWGFDFQPIYFVHVSLPVIADGFNWLRSFCLRAWMLPSEGAVNLMLKMGCVILFNLSVFSDWGCAGWGQWRRHSSLSIHTKEWTVPGLLDEPQTPRSVQMLLSWACILKFIWPSDCSAPCSALSCCSVSLQCQCQADFRSESNRSFQQRSKRWNL